MAITSYIYSVADDTLNGIVAADALFEQIDDDGDVVIDSHAVCVMGDVLEIQMKDALSGPQETALTAVVAAHDGVPLPSGIQVGTVLYCVNGTNLEPELPVTGPAGWLVNNDGILIVNG